MPDPLEALLRRSPLTQRQRADIWDAYEAAKDEDELTAALQGLSVPKQVKANLWDLKVASATARPGALPGAPPPMAEMAPLPKPGLAERASDFAAGAAKGYGQTMMRTMGPLAMGPLGVAAAGTRGGYVATPEALEPTPAQQTGHTVEQMAEFLAPGGAVSRAGKALGTGAKALAGRAGLEALTAGGLALEQTEGDPKAAAVSAALGATGPVLGAAASKAGAGLRKLAETQYGRALAATTNRMKETSARIVPELLSRQVKGTVEGLAKRGKEESAAVGKALGEAYEGASAAGVKSKTAPIIKALDDVKERFFAQNDAGEAIAVNPAAIAKVEAMQELIGKFGETVRPDQLWALRKNIDDIIKAGGGFGAEVSPVTTKALQREARTAVQRELNKATPDIEKLNSEFSLWKGLEDVARATAKRKIGQSGIVELGVRTTIGGAAGALLGGDDKVWGPVGAMLGALTKHPLYRTVSAGEKARLAHALSSGKATTATSILSRLLAGFGARDQSSDQPPTSTP